MKETAYNIFVSVPKKKLELEDLNSGYLLRKANQGFDVGALKVKDKYPI